MKPNFINYLEFLESDPLAAPEEFEFAQDIRKLLAVVEAAKVVTNDWDLKHEDFSGALEKLSDAIKALEEP